MEGEKSAPRVRLVPVTADEAPVLENLIQLYAHDLSDVFALEAGADGRFAYDQLPLYWSEPQRRFAFLIRHDGRLAGFALATRGSPASEDPDALDVAEFFVLRRHRRDGVGRAAAFLLWDALPGRWVVRVSEGNHAGRRFWERVTVDYARGPCPSTRRPGTPHAWRVFTVDSRRHG